MTDLESIRQRHPSGQLVWVAGNFNTVHPGHLRLINFARSCGDVLVIGLFTDAAKGVTIPFDDRREVLASIVGVDEIVPVPPENLISILKDLRPEIVVKGGEHQRAPNTETQILSSYGGKLIFSPGETHFHPRDPLLLGRQSNEPLPLPIEHDEAFLERRVKSGKTLLGILERYESKKVAVVGDVILDEYIDCDAIGMSQEDPTIVVTPATKRDFLGGAGIVAAHLVGLGAETSFFSVVGRDSAASRVRELLSEFHVKSNLITDTSRQTSRKERFRSAKKTLLRVNHLNSHEIDLGIQGELFSQIDQAIANVDALVFSDFNYGCLPTPLVNRISALCQKRKVPYFSDSQSSSQVGDVSRFKKAEFLSATEREVRLAVNDFRSGLQFVGNQLLTQSGANALLLKLAEDGLIAILKDEEFSTDKMRALNKNPMDVAGAGDALLAAGVLARISTGNTWEAAYIGSVAAAIQVSKVGNIPLTLTELKENLTKMNYKRSVK